MIKKLQKKFIMITACTLLVLMTILVACINGVNIYRNTNQLDELLNHIYGNDSEFNMLEEKRDKAGESAPEGEKKNDDDKNSILKRPSTSSHCLVTLDENMEVVSVQTDNENIFTEDVVNEFVSQIKDGVKENGWVEGIRFKLGEADDGYLVALVDGSQAKSSMISVLAISSGVAIFSYLIVLLIIILFSKRAISPLAESYEKQRRFITNANHEMKTPLTIISANAEILSMTIGENEWVEGITKQSVRLRDLVNQLVTVTKMDEESLLHEKKKFCVSDAVYDTAMAFTGLAQNKGLSLSIQIDPSVYVNGDEASIRQLTSILLDNALKYCDDQGSITVNLTSKGSQMKLSVQNSYQNVKKLPLSQLFDRFYRADKARTSNGSYGLGLSIAKSIVEFHHGTIKAKNLDGNEIEFFVRL